MKKLKLIFSAVSLALILVLAAGLGACGLFGGGTNGGNNGGGNGGGGGSQTTPDPMIGVYKIVSTAHVAPDYFGGCPAQTTLEIDDTQFNPSADGKITIAADADISFYAVGAFAIGFQMGTGTGVSGSINAISYYAEANVGYRCIKTTATTNPTRLWTIQKKGAIPITEDVYVSITFTHANDTIALTMRYELTTDTAKGWTQTFDFAKQAA